MPMPLEVLGHDTGDAPAVRTVDRAAGVRLLTGSVTRAAPATIDSQHLRIAVGQPTGRRCGGGTEDGGDPVGPEHVHRALEQAEVVQTFAWFHEIPGELRHAD